MFTYFKPKTEEEIIASIKRMSSYDISSKLIFMSVSVSKDKSCQQLLLEEFEKKTRKIWTVERHYQIIQHNYYKQFKKEAREECKTGWSQSKNQYKNYR